MLSQVPAKETLPQVIRRVLVRPLDELLVERVAGTWTPTSSAKLLERVENLACAIRGAGLNAGDRVALVAHDCVDWIVADFAVLFSGCVVVPIFPTQALDHLAYILEHSEAKLLFADTPATCDHVRASGAALPPTVVFSSQGADGLQAFEARGEALRKSNPALPAAYEAAQHPDDLAVLIYTSGTTGNPKGVMLSHDNVSFDAQAALSYGLEGIGEGSDVLSVLPYSHIFEHTIVYIYLLARVRYFICHDPNDLLADLQSVRPASMTAVPRLFDRVLAGVKGSALKAGGLRARLVLWALDVGRDYAFERTFGEGRKPWLAFRYAVARALVLRKVRRALGLDRMKFFTSGSAALHVDTAMTFLAMDVPIMQGYGLTETSPVTTISRLPANRYGAVGRPLPGIDVRIAEDGEVLTRGRQVMQGYYHDPESTAAVLQDGWLHTGDIGSIDEQGFLHITDRKREVFKTDTGKWVSPARVEASLKRSLFIVQAMVVGDGRPFPVALVCPNWEMLRLELSLPDEATERLAGRKDVIDFLAGEAQHQTAELAGYEQIRRVIPIGHEFSVDSGELSPSMKIKRRVVESRYAGEIDRLYGVDRHRVPA